MTDLKAPPVHRCVHPQDLQAATTEGWELVGSFSQGRLSVISLADGVFQMERDGYANGAWEQSGTVIHAQREDAHVLHETQFLLRKTDTADLVSELRAKVFELERQLVDLKDYLEAVAKRETLLINQNRRLDEDLHAVRTARQKMQDSLDKYEADMARLRHHFGQKAFDEALTED